MFQPSFELSVHVFDYDRWDNNDDLGVTSYTYTGNSPTIQTVTTIPGNKNMRYVISIVWWREYTLDMLFYHTMPIKRKIMIIHVVAFPPGKLAIK